jgi:uncharacterized membrane protein
VIARPPTPRPDRAGVATGFIVSIAAQLALTVIGVIFLFTPSVTGALGVLVLWCAIGTLYVVVVAVVLARASLFAQSDEPPMLMEVSGAARAVSVVCTVLASAVGVAAAIQHIFFLDPRADRDSFLLDTAGIWAMVLSWMLLHWGFAQIYLQQYYRSSERPLRFPAADAPGILEFAYFAYTIGVSLAVSDVEVRDRRMRWRVLTHAVIGFFFNAVIVVTALGAINEAGALQ